MEVAILPVIAAQGRHGLVRAAALVVSIPWFIGVGMVVMPVMLVLLIVAVWRDLGEPDR